MSLAALPSNAPLAEFLPVPGRGQRFILVHQAAAGQPVRGRVLFLHAFAEEMNKSRRMVAEQARALARQGFVVLQIDLLGCGDSSGDFADASWDDWLADGQMAIDHLAGFGSSPLWLWGMRAGALLAAELAARQAQTPHCLFWQPSSSGKQLLQQFLRLKSASSLISGQGKGAMAEAQQQLARGLSVDVAGYTLGAPLAQGLEKARLSAPQPHAPGARLVWLEVSTQAEASFSPVAEQGQQAWREAGWQVEAALLQGPQFWQTTEIEMAPALIESSSRLLGAQS